MFLGADKFRHQEYGAIKKCSKCHDKNLRYLNQLSAGGKQPVFLCGNGHVVFPEYDENSPNTAYVLLEGDPIYDIPFEVEQGSHGTKNCGCCDGGASYGCNLPNQITIDISGLMGTYGTRRLAKPVVYNYFYPYEVDSVTWAGDDDPLPEDWMKQPWSVTCGSLSANGSCVSEYYPEGCNQFSENWPGCIEWCDSEFSLNGDFVGDLESVYAQSLIFWGVSPYDASFIQRSSCGGFKFPNCLNWISNPGDPLIEDCEHPLDLPICHECGTLRCFEENSTYRVPCSYPTDNFTMGFSTRSPLNTGIKYQDIQGLPHRISFNNYPFGYHGAGTPASICDIKDFTVTIHYPYSAELGANGDLELSASTLFEIQKSVNFDTEQPQCLRRASYNSLTDIHTGDIINQTIILDRINYNSSIVWEESERRARQNEPNQAFIEYPLINASGSDVEPELIALIISESGTGGQIAFQTYPVTFDTDEFVEDYSPQPKTNCKTKSRVKAFGYGVMYPFIDDPIWRTENAALEGETFGGGPAYNFPVFLPGKNYKVGDKIEFRFWQTLDNPPEPDPSAGEIYRTVVLATATITEVDSNGGILWYEFDGDPISGDCPCTKDKYCGWLSRACYPEEHPNTDDGIEGWCPRGESCETLSPEECNLSLPVYTGSSCYPLTPSWDIGGYYGKSSCSGIAEPGIPASWDGEYGIPAKAPRYYYAWLPDPDCFFAYDEDFLEYMAFNEYFDFNGPFFNQDRDDFPGCSPLFKIYRNSTTSNLDIKTRFKDYFVAGPPCRKTYVASDANTLFVAYEGGDGSIVNETVSQRTNDNYCRVYGFYQQKQYDCGVTYQGQYILRSQYIGEGNLTCEPTIGTVTIRFERKEVKNDITISAPVNQNYLLPEFLPAPDNGIVSATWPYQQGKLNNWAIYDPLNHIPDPRGNCAISTKVYYEQNGKIEYDCDNFWTTEDNGATWDANDYKEYYDSFNQRTAWRTTFVPSCGYPWEYNCKKSGTNSDFIDPTPSCYIDENGEVICDGIDETGNFTDPEQDPCDPYCMLSNSSATIAIKEIETAPGCPYGQLITADDRYFFMSCSPFQANYTSIIEIPGLPRNQTCANHTSHIPGNNDFVAIFAFGDKDLVTPQMIDAKIQEYLSYWEQRYQNLGLGWPGVAAIIGNNQGQPFDRGLTNFYNTMFEIDGLGRIHLLNQLCIMSSYFPPTNNVNDCPTIDDWLAAMYNEGRNAVPEFAGRIKEISIINPGAGYAFEVEERYAPTGIIQPSGIEITINSIIKNRRRKSETWTLEEYSLTHSGEGYSIGDTIPISFNDSDAIRDGVQYKSIPTIEVINVDSSGQITETSILNSGEYYKWMKTGQHRAYPVSIILNNYWESPKEGMIGIGRHAELRAVVGVDPTKDTYGQIVDIIIDQSGIEYLPTGKYWSIDTNFSSLGLDHLVDPCKYDLLAKDDNPEKHWIDFSQNRIGPPAGFKHVLPPLEMNGGNIIKWSDRALSWNTVITSGDCPTELINKTYKMALSESVNLMSAKCSSATCQDVIETRYYGNEGNPERSGYYICNRWTGFYAHAHEAECGNNGSYDDAWRAALLFGQNNGAVIGIGGSADIPWYSCTDIAGCDGELPPHDGLNSPIGFYYPGNSNGSDNCGNGTEYSIVGQWVKTPDEPINSVIYYGSSHTHRIYKMAGQDITMTVKPRE